MEEQLESRLQLCPLCDFSGMFLILLHLFTTATTTITTIVNTLMSSILSNLYSVIYYEYCPLLSARL